jgi:hypothetical protein
LEAFTDAVRLWTLDLGARVIAVLDREIQLVFMPFTFSPVLRRGRSRRAHSQQPSAMSR